MPEAKIPYVTAIGNITKVLEKIQPAKTPERFTQDFLMAPHYETFFALENSIRAVVGASLESEDGEDWWTKGRVPPTIQQDSEARYQREIDLGMTPRSHEMLDYTTFGELSEIIKANWDLFGALLSSKKAVERVMVNLNSLRAPIAHCSGLAEDEVVRLRLAVRDWFRLME